MGIILRKEDGSERVVPEGVSYRLEPGEKLVGSDGQGTEDKFEHAIKPFLTMLGMGLADFIVLASKALGMEQCARCQWREKFLRRVGELGPTRTFQLIMQTFKKEWKPDASS